MEKITVAIVGARGYSGLDLQDYLKHCPEFEVKFAVGREGLSDEEIQQCSLVFLCTPNEVSMELAPRILSHGVNVIDLSGAFRLKKHEYPEWYGFEHQAKDWLEKSEYCLQPWSVPTPLSKKEGPRLIANPGCYSSATEMALLPLLKESLVDPKLIKVDAKSGTSGAGKKANSALLFTELFGEFKPYKVGAHQHWPEIVECAAEYANAKIDPVFVTELLPIERGISAACFFEWAPSVPEERRNVESLVSAYQSAYSGCEDILVSTEDEFLSLKKVQRSNRVHLVVKMAFGRPMVFSLIDNLGRGAAGQALMNAFALYGLEQPRCLK